MTVGSDAHCRADLGKNLKVGYELADYCDLKPVYFKERSLEYVPLHDSKSSYQQTGILSNLTTNTQNAASTLLRRNLINHMNLD